MNKKVIISEKGDDKLTKEQFIELYSIVPKEDLLIILWSSGVCIETLSKSIENRIRAYIGRPSIK